MDIPYCCHLAHILNNSLPDKKWVFIIIPAFPLMLNSALTSQKACELQSQRGWSPSEGDFSVLPVGLARAMGHGGHYVLSWPTPLSQEGSLTDRCASKRASSRAAPRFSWPRIRHSRAAAWCSAVLSKQREGLCTASPPQMHRTFRKTREVSACVACTQHRSFLFLTFMSHAEKWFLFLVFASSVFAFVCKTIKNQIEKEY